MMAFLMLSAGMLTPLAARIAVRRRGFASGSPPLRAAIVISLMMRVNDFPRLASRAAFLCLMVAHFEWPDIWIPQEGPGPMTGRQIVSIPTKKDSRFALGCRAPRPCQINGGGASGRFSHCRIERRAQSRRRGLL